MGLPITNPTYILAPNWTFRPDGPIALGNIIANPLKPHIVLTRPDPSSPVPETVTVSESDVRITDGGGRAVSLSLWANFLETVQLKVGGHRSTALTTAYSIEKLSTTYFKDGITPELITERAKDPIITTLMKPDSFLSKPVFMVTGIKVAKGFKLSAESKSSYGSELGAGFPTGGPASAGGEGKFSADKNQAYEFSSDEDVVFAYQLLKLSPKGWGKNRAVHGTEYQSTAVFLADDGGDDGDTQLEVEFGYFVTADLSDLGMSPDQVVDEMEGTNADGTEKYSAVSAKQDAASSSTQQDSYEKE